MFNKVDWLLLYTKNKIEVYANSKNLYEDFNVKIDGKWIERFKGENAYSECEKMVHGKGQEYQDLDIVDILASAHVQSMNNSMKFFEDTIEDK